MSDILPPPETETADAPRQRRVQESVLLILVSLTAIVANLPERYLAPLGMQPGYLLAILGFIVLLALFLYVRFFFFILYVLMAIGANVPSQWAEALGIAQLPLLITLIAMVVLSLLNYAVKVLPTGVEGNSRAGGRTFSAEGARALFAAIERGNTQQLRHILTTDIELDILDEAGDTPLMRAARRGYAEMVAALLDAGADPRIFNERGQTARDIALRQGHALIVKQLSSSDTASAAATTTAAPAPSAGV